MPVWDDASKCMVSMKHMPYRGGTFKDTAISEEGRRLLASRLGQLTPGQIESLFATAGLKDAPTWSAVFQDRVRQIVYRPACPAAKNVS